MTRYDFLSTYSWWCCLSAKQQCCGLPLSSPSSPCFSFHLWAIYAKIKRSNKLCLFTVDLKSQIIHLLLSKWDTGNWSSGGFFFRIKLFMQLRKCSYTYIYTLHTRHYPGVFWVLSGAQYCWSWSHYVDEMMWCRARIQKRDMRPVQWSGLK